jgi:hypothetical protein
MYSIFHVLFSLPITASSVHCKGCVHKLCISIPFWSCVHGFISLAKHKFLKKTKWNPPVDMLCMPTIKEVWEIMSRIKRVWRVRCSAAGFLKFCRFWLCMCNFHCYTLSMPMSKSTFPVEKVVCSIPAPCRAKHRPRSVALEEQQNVHQLFWRTLKIGLHGFLQNCARPEKVCKDTRGAIAAPPSSSCCSKHCGKEHKGGGHCGPPSASYCSKWW